MLGWLRTKVTGRADAPPAGADIEDDTVAEDHFGAGLGTVTVRKVTVSCTFHCRDVFGIEYGNSGRRSRNGSRFRWFDVAVVFWQSVVLTACLCMVGPRVEVSSTEERTKVTELQAAVSDLAAHQLGHCTVDILTRFLKG
jgi:hypothetical protein